MGINVGSKLIMLYKIIYKSIVLNIYRTLNSLEEAIRKCRDQMLGQD